MSLRERRDVVRLCRETGAGGVLFTVVRVSGSSYRRPGARLAAAADGRTAGTLSGGCLEADLLRRSAWIVRNGAAVEYFSTAFDNTAEIPYGLGCGGEIDLLAEPADTAEADALTAALEASLQGEGCTVGTLLPGAGQPMMRLVIDAERNVVFASDALPTETIVDLRSAALRAAHGEWVEVRGAGSLFVEQLEAAQRLVIFGAGEDARPLARLASEMGWTVIVADGRVQHAKAERFPAAQSVAVTTSAAAVPVRAEDAVVLMTHSFEQDGRLLAELLPMNLRYLGLLGARHRSALLLHEAAAACGLTLAAAVERTHAPIGLDLGGDGPEAVALAIVSELQAVLTGGTERPARSRRMSAADAERRLAEGPAMVVRADSCAMYPEQAAVSR